MTATLTKNEFLKYLNTTIGKQYDFDGYYGYQCFDYANIGWNKLFGHGLKGASAKDIPFNAENKANLKKEATVYENTPSFKAKPGDLVVFDEKYGEGDGHVAWVISATLNEIVVLEQNWEGGGWADGIEQGGKGWEKVTKRTHAYDFPMWFIRPKFKAETTKTESTKKESTTKKTKQRTIKYDRTTFKNASVIPKRGYKPKGVIIHNTADDLTPQQQKNRMMNYNAGQLADGIAHSYVGDGEIWQVLPESYSAWHAGDAWANQNLYGIEAGISSNTPKDKAIRIEQTALQEAGRMLKKWKLPVNKDTVFLHNEFTATRCPVRSMELHANWYSTQRAPQQIVDKMKKYFIDQIKQYYKGENPKGSTVKPSKPSSNTSSGKWKKNQYGTWWMKESATFTCGGSPIMARVGSPFLTAQEGYWFQPGGYVNYDEVCIQDGHVWIGYTFKGVRYYLPIRTVKGTPPNHIVGDLWGTIS
ncbi:SH3 domain-containing protein [Mammaliicoccus sciuri]|uniref:SH3 domain-containing protein n=1 Tax=Mammaliicoccus sciuri TaxID=1296 RepID=UPI00194F4107|nr:SH3 domain-containing protein [Mammaliicoccus sciuri]MCJ0912913.1 SH3 domain-containing protein [Mammaliicoccus sciuri]MEB6339614.1 SH3 domain-containing protein [Mammaliicoccus sciuri]MEB7402332.1 SH3 domain-containing protein [Mammaliicoccus sciuri]MEB8133535.1 SH3 domain-containing protein [Mammaliicoccus sciuri]